MKASEKDEAIKVEERWLFSMVSFFARLFFKDVRAARAPY